MLINNAYTYIVRKEKKTKQKEIILRYLPLLNVFTCILQNKQNDNVFCHGCWNILRKVTGNVTSPICQKFYALHIYFRSRSKQAVGLMAQLFHFYR